MRIVLAIGLWSWLLGPVWAQSARFEYDQNSAHAFGRQFVQDFLKEDKAAFMSHVANLDDLHEQILFMVRLNKPTDPAAPYDEEQKYWDFRMNAQQLLDGLGESFDIFVEESKNAEAPLSAGKIYGVFDLPEVNDILVTSKIYVLVDAGVFAGRFRLEAVLTAKGWKIVDFPDWEPKGDPTAAAPAEEDHSGHTH